MDYSEVMDNIKNNKYDTTLPYPDYKANISNMKKEIIKKAYNADNVAKGKLFKPDLRIWATQKFLRIPTESSCM